MKLSNPSKSQMFKMVYVNMCLNLTLRIRSQKERLLKLVKVKIHLKSHQNHSFLYKHLSNCLKMF